MVVSLARIELAASPSPRERATGALQADDLRRAVVGVTGIEPAIDFRLLLPKQVPYH